MNNQQSQNPKTGLFLIGVLKGVRQYQKQGSSYINYFVGICVGEKIDGYGATSEEIEELSINDKQYMEILRQPELVGQPVKAPFKISLRSGVNDKGKPWSYVSQYLIPECHVEPLNKVQPVPEKKSS